MQTSVISSVKRLEAAIGAKRINKAYEHFLHTTARLTSYADPTTGLLKAGTQLRLFSTPSSQRGQGFDTNPISPAQTNFNGSNNQLPMDSAFIAQSIGFQLSPDAPPHVLRKLLFRGLNNQIPLNDSNVQQLGPPEFFPCDFGPNYNALQVSQTPPAAGASIIGFSTNGPRGLRRFSGESELIFKPGDKLEVLTTVHEDVFLTTTGVAAQNADEIVDVLYSVVLFGVKTEVVRA